MYLIDSDILIFFINGYPNVVDRLLENDLDKLNISSITVAEIHVGLNYKRKNSSRYKKALGILKKVNNINFSKKEAQEYGVLKSKLMSSGDLVVELDMLIAATAIANKLTLVTNNTKHFSRIADLKIENWTE